MSATADASLRSSLVTVLETFGVPYEDIQRNGQSVLAFQVGPGMQHFSYQADHAQAEGVVRKLANLLLSAGLQPKRTVSFETSPPRLTKATFRPTQRRHDAAIGQNQPVFPEDAEQPEIVARRPVAPILPAEPAVRVEPAEVNSEAKPDPHPSKPDPHLSKPDSQAMPSPPSPSQGLLVYQPKPEYAPAEVFVVRAVKDMIIMANEYLLIPAHHPQSMFVLSEEEIQARYAPAAFVAPSLEITARSRSAQTQWLGDSLHYSPTLTPQTAPPAPTVSPRSPTTTPTVQAVPPAPMVPEYDPALVPQTASPATISRLPLTRTDEPSIHQPAPAPIAPSALTAMDDDAIAMDDDAIAMDDEHEADVLVMAPLPMPSKVVETPVRMQQSLSRGRPRIEPNLPTVKIPAQIGRILLGIRQAMIVNNASEVTATEAGPYMPEGDRKQIGARTAAAEDAGWVKRRRRGTSTGYFYSVTSIGARLAEQQATRCYLESGLAVPPFLKQR